MALCHGFAISLVHFCKGGEFKPLEVNLCSLYGCMPQHFADGFHWRSLVLGQCGPGVAERVAADVLIHADVFGQLVQTSVDPP